MTTSSLTEVLQRRVEFYNKDQPRNKDGEWTRAGKAWSGVSAHPDRRTKPKSKVWFPAEKRSYESAHEANERFARSIYNADLPGGFRSKVHAVNVYTENGKRVMEVSGRIQAPNDAVVGFWTRTITAESTTKSFVTHDELFIDRNQQGKGLADAFNAHAVREYQKLGVDRIEVSAGDMVGGFAWARQGFRWDNRGDPEYGNKAAQKALDVIETHHKSSDDVKRQARALRDALDLGEDVQPIHVASLGEREAWDGSGGQRMWAGKEAMMRQAWSGVYYFDANQAVTVDI